MVVKHPQPSHIKILQTDHLRRKGAMPLLVRPRFFHRFVPSSRRLLHASSYTHKTLGPPPPLRTNLPPIAHPSAPSPSLTAPPSHLPAPCPSSTSPTNPNPSLPPPTNPAQVKTTPQRFPFFPSKSLLVDQSINSPSSRSSINAQAPSRASAWDIILLSPISHSLAPLSKPIIQAPTLLGSLGWIKGRRTWLCPAPVCPKLPDESFTHPENPMLKWCLIHKRSRSSTIEFASKTPSTCLTLSFLLSALYDI